MVGLDSLQGQGLFIFAVSRPALGPTQLPLKWAPEALSPWVQWPGHEAAKSPPSSVDFKNTWTYTFARLYIHMMWCLIKHMMSSWCGT